MASIGGDQGELPNTVVSRDSETGGVLIAVARQNEAGEESISHIL